MKKTNSAREKDLRIVKGVVRNNEVSGGSIDFSFRKYKEDPIVNYSFEDGEEVEIPAMIADHLNSCMYYEQVKSETLDANGLPVNQKPKSFPRFSFISTSY